MVNRETVLRSFAPILFMAVGIFLTANCFDIQMTWAVSSSSVGVSNVVDIFQKPWFTMHTQRRIDQGVPSNEVTFINSNQVLLSKESVTLTPSGALKNYHWNQFQSGKVADIILDGNSLRFKLCKSKDPQECEESEMHLKNEQRDRLVVPPMIEGYLVSHWDVLESSGQLELLIAVPDRRDTFSFHFAKADTQDSETVTWVLKANSFFVRLKAGPVDFVYGPNHQLLAIKNFTPPVLFEEKDHNLRARETDIVFKTPSVPPTKK